MGDFIYENIGWASLFLFMVLLGAIAICVKNDNDANNKFMQECGQDHKRYECEAMWRSGESHEQMVPVFIPMQGR